MRRGFLTHFSLANIKSDLSFFVPVASRNAAGATLNEGFISLFAHAGLISGVLTLKCRMKQMATRSLIGRARLDSLPEVKFGKKERKEKKNARTCSA